jgi:signal transduction histidine kinase
MIEVDVKGQPLRVAVPRWPQNWSLPGYLRGQPVTIRGVPGRAWRREDGVVRGTLYTWSIREIEVDPETLARLFDRPARKYRELFEFDLLRDSPLIRIRGHVSFHQPGQGFFVLLDEERRVWVQSSAPGQLVSGDLVDVVGRRDRFEERPMLTDGFYRVERPGAPEPTWSRQAGEVRDEPGRSHGTLIDIEGRLVEQFSSLSEDSLVLEDGGVAFLARLRRTGQSRLPVLAADTRLRLRGTCLSRRMPLADNLPSSFTFQLWIEKPGDVAVVRLPPWWTKRRLLWLCGAILFAGLLAGTWVLVLRRQVARQSEIIGHLREREAVSRERARIARELHDSLGQELVGISLQLDSAAARLAGAPEQAGRALDLARTMIRHSQAEAKRSVWDLRAENLDGVDLPPALERALQPMVAAPGSPRLRVNVKGSHRRLPGVVEHHLLRIGQEAVTNAVRHARASQIHMELRYGARDVTLEVRDDGCGFEAAEAIGVASGHFGLLGLRERANKLQGRLHIQSQPGAGTVVTVTAPCDPTENLTS